MALAMARSVDMSKIEETVSKIDTEEDITNKEALKVMLALNLNSAAALTNVTTKVNEITELAKSNEERIKELENKVGDKEECAENLSIAVQNVLMFPHGDNVTVKQVISNIDAEGVNPDTDVVKVVRKGYKPANATQKEKLDTVLVELKSSDIRSRIMIKRKIWPIQQIHNSK